MVNEGIAQTSTIDRTKLLSQSYANIYNLINDRSNVADPKGNQERVFVYTREPHMQGRGFSSELFPFVVLKRPNLDMSNSSLDEKNAMVSGEIICEVYSSDEMKGHHKDKGSRYFNEVVDDIFETINSASNKLTLRTCGQTSVNITTDETDDIEFNNKTIYLGRFTISFSARLTVSA